MDKTKIRKLHLVGVRLWKPSSDPRRLAQLRSLVYPTVLDFSLHGCASIQDVFRLMANEQTQGLLIVLSYSCSIMQSVSKDATTKVLQNCNILARHCDEPLKITNGHGSNTHWEGIREAFSEKTKKLNPSSRAHVPHLSLRLAIRLVPRCWLWRG